MRIVRPNATPVNSDGGRSGDSGIPSWKRRWIEDKIRLVELECGCIEDINLSVLTFIYTFDGCEIDCVKHHRFSRVKRTIKRRPVKYPDNPLF